VAYSEQTWHDSPATDTPITAARITHIEDGVTANDAAISGLGGAATLNVGTAAGTVAAGNDSRFSSYGKLFQSGYWSTVLPCTGAGLGAQAVVLNVSQLCTLPFIMSHSLTFNGMGLHVYGTAVTSATLRIGFYNDSSGSPGSLLADFGTLSMSTGGIQSATISQAMTPGIYWLAWVQQGGSAPSQTFGGNMVSLLGDSRDVTAGASYDDEYMISSATTYGTGGLPGTFPALSTTVVAAAPRIVFKAA
jgi:hypothetical protein